jgi:hypothetical protein
VRAAHGLGSRVVLGATGVALKLTGERSEMGVPQPEAGGAWPG